MAHEIPDVTIVVTAYNHAHFLAAALESIKAQTMPVKEIIVVDDGSSDDPAEVVERFSGVKLIKQNNQGLSAARNTGLRAAHGSFVGFLDADDRLLATMVEVNLRQFEHNPDCAFVYGAYQLVDAKGNVTAKPPLCEPGDDAYASFLVNNLVGMHGTVLYRREILHKEGGFDTTLRAVEDYDVYLRLARNYPVSAEEETLASYFRHDSNMSNDNAFMLKWALAVQARHRETASTRTDWQEAFNLGQQGWKSYFIRKQLGTLKYAAKRRIGLRAAVAGTAGILRLEPGATVGEIRKWVRKRLPSRKRVRFGDLRRTTPIDANFGYSRGKPLDRYYIERFLQENAGDIQNRVLEIGDSAYTRQFGGDRVTQADVLNRYAGHPETTFVGDLTEAADLPSDAFDCIVLTQTLHLIFDMQASIETLWRVLRPGGVLLVTVPWISPIDRGEWGDDWMWSISSQGLQKLLCGPFQPEQTRVQDHGNVLAATAFLYGLAMHELKQQELDVDDPCCPVLVTGRAVKVATA